MNTRREFLKMLGIVGTGTVLGEHLSYLVRQPYSVAFSRYPYMTDIMISEQSLEDVLVEIAREVDDRGIPLRLKPTSIWIRDKDENKCLWHTAVQVTSPQDEFVVVREKGRIALPDNAYVAAPVEPFWAETMLMDKAEHQKWLMRETAHRQVLRLEPGGVMLERHLTLPDVTEFEDLWKHDRHDAGDD